MMKKLFWILFVLFVFCGYLINNAEADTVVYPGINTISRAAANASSGESIILTNGTYKQTEPIDIRGKSLSIFGKGPEVTIIKCTNTHGINIVTNSVSKHVTLSDFTLATTNTGGYDAIRFRANRVMSNSNKQFLVRNLSIRPFNNSRDYWRRGISLQEGWNTSITDCFIRGRNNSTRMSSCIELSGYSVDVTIHNTHMMFARHGVNVMDYCEGVYISSCPIIYTVFGIWWNTRTEESLLSVTGCHISTFSHGIFTYNVHWSNITANMIAKRHDSDQNYVGIFLISGDMNTVTGNVILGEGKGGSENGIVVEGCTWSTVIGNVIRDQDTSIWIRGGSYKCEVGGNTGDGGVLDQGRGTIKF